MGKREKVIEALENAGEISDGVLTMSDQFRDVLVELLKEQEAVKPYVDIDEAKCPICKVRLTRQELLGEGVLFEDFFNYCPKCGRPVDWESMFR